MADSREQDPADALAAMTGGGAKDEFSDAAEQRAGDDDMMAAPAPDAWACPRPR